MVLIDTNIAVALWVANDATNQARELLNRDSHWRTESLALIEFSNVMRTYVHAALATLPEALKRLEEAERFLLPGIHVVAHRDALRAAIDFGVSAYDARFLVAADALGIPLITGDGKLRRAAPTLTQSLEQALA